MTDPRELLDRYAARHVNDMGDRLDETVPEVIAALRAVLDIHQPESIESFADDNDLCPDCRDSKPIRAFTRRFMLQTVTVDHRMHEHPDPKPHCAGCLAEDDSSGEPLTATVPWPCPTVQAIVQALEAK